MNKINNYISKLNIILLVANITIAGAFFLSKSSNVQTKDLSYQTNTDLFIKKELGFSEEQYQKYLEINSATLKGYKRVEELICKRHYEFLLELSKNEPNIKVLDSLSRAIAKNHAGLKVFTARHFLNIKSICTPEQDLKLQELIKEMLHIGSCEDCIDPECNHKPESEGIN